MTQSKRQERRNAQRKKENGTTPGGTRDTFGSLGAADVISIERTTELIG